MNVKAAWLSILIAAATLCPSIPMQAAENPPTLDSEAAILIDSHTGQVLFEKNSHERMYPASITKIVTATVAIESGRLDEVATVSKHATEVEGTKVYLEPGEQKTIHELLYGLLLHSGNDVANVIAEQIGGDQEKFADKMNALVEKVTHSNDTHFVNPHGLFDKNHYVTAYDMALLSRYAMEHPLFREIVSTPSYQWDGKKWKTKLMNQNQLLKRYPGTIGIKNGFIDQSLNTLVTAVNRNNTEYIAVVLKAHGKEKAYEDTIKLMDYGFANFEDKQILSKGQKIKAPSGTEYQVDEDIFATVKKGESASYKLDQQGNLVIHTNNSDQLLDGKIKPIMKQPTNTASSTATGPAALPWWAYGVGILIIAGASIVIHLKVRQNQAV